jgi:hypothetical protein
MAQNLAITMILIKLDREPIMAQPPEPGERPNHFGEGPERVATKWLFGLSRSGLAQRTNESSLRSKRKLAYHRKNVPTISH